MSKDIEKPKDSDSKSTKGFASNPENINRGGRPKGSRNKSTLIKAQLRLDDMSLQATEIIQAIMNNDKETLGLKETEDVPVTLRLAAAKEALNKAVANEKEKEPQKPAGEAARDEEEDNTPIFSPVPVKSA